MWVVLRLAMRILLILPVLEWNRSMLAMNGEKS